MHAVPLGIRNPRRTRFYVVAALLASILTFAGFFRSFFFRPFYDLEPLSVLANAHGVTMLSWYVLFITQSVLISRKRVDLHRRLGMFGAGLAVLILIIGIPTMIVGARLGHTPMPAVPFLAISLMLFLQFAVLVGAGIALRRKSETHKRLMLLALLSTLAPAFTRLPIDFIYIGAPLSIIAWSNLLLVGCVIYDSIKHRRLHPVFGFGLVFLPGMQLMSMFIAMDPTWAKIATWILR